METVLTSQPQDPIPILENNVVRLLDGMPEEGDASVNLASTGLVMAVLRVSSALRTQGGLAETVCVMKA